MSVQCSRGSQALPIDYYSATKKTLTPLNEACTLAPSHHLLCSSKRNTRCLSRVETNSSTALREKLANLGNNDSTMVFRWSLFAVKATIMIELDARIALTTRS